MPSEPYLSSYQCVLDWAATPKDLDIHMSGPDGSGGRFHHFWGTRTSPPVAYVRLDMYARHGWGIENITLTTDPSTDKLLVAGEYHVWVVNRSRELNQKAPDWFQSRARIRMYQELTYIAAAVTIRQQIATAHANRSGGPIKSVIWNGFTFTVDTHFLTDFAFVDQLVSGSSYTVL